MSEKDIPAKNTKIYTKLSLDYPDKFKQLTPIPKSIPHPGDEPRSPYRTYHLSIKIIEGDSIEVISDKLKQLNNGKIESLGVYYIDPDEYRQYYTEPREKGIEISAMLESPNYDLELSKYHCDKEEWKKNLNLYQARKQEIKEAEEHNRKLIQDAFTNQKPLWIAAGRALSGKRTSEMVRAEIEKLEYELEFLKSMEK